LIAFYASYERNYFILVLCHQYSFKACSRMFVFLFYSQNLDFISKRQSGGSVFRNGRSVPTAVCYHTYHGSSICSAGTLGQFIGF
jgi:hypothetical protein